MPNIAPRYDNTALLASLSTIQTAQRVLKYAATEWVFSEQIYPFRILEGAYNPNAMPPIIKVDELSKGAGATARIDTRVRNYDTPYAMTNVGSTLRFVDTHGLEFLIKHGYFDVTLTAWGGAFAVDEFEKQVSRLLDEIKMVQNGGDWVQYYKSIQVLNCLLGKDFIGHEETGADRVLETGKYPQTQFYANDKANIAALGTSDVMQLDFLSDAQLALASGHNYSGSDSWQAYEPVVMGKKYRGVAIMHEFVMRDIQKKDPKYFATLKDADVRGPENKLFGGLERAPEGFVRKFDWDGILLLTLSGKLGDQLIIAVDEIVKDINGSSNYHASVNCAATIFLGGAAMVRAVGNREDFLKTEFGENKWDGWLNRCVFHNIIGTKPCQVPLAGGDLTTAQSSNETDLREMGRCIIYTATDHPISFSG